MQPDPILPKQLALPLDLDAAPPRPPPPLGPRAMPARVWAGLSPATRAGVRETWLRVLREAVDDARER
jgi:hypothetical protein